VINDAYAPWSTAAGGRRGRRAALFRAKIVAGGPGFAAHAVVGAPVVSAGVYVAVPPPPVVQVGVGIGLGGRRHRGGPGPVYERHDNGRHNGWYKHGTGGRRHRAGGEARRRRSSTAGAAPGARRRWLARGWGPPPAAHGNGWRGGPTPHAQQQKSGRAGDGDHATVSLSR